MPEIASWESLFGGLYNPSTAMGDYLEGEVSDTQAAPADAEPVQLPGYTVTQPQPQATAAAAPVETTVEAAETPTSDRFTQVQNLVESIDSLSQRVSIPLQRTTSPGANLPGGAPAGGWEASPEQLPSWAIQNDPVNNPDPRTIGINWTSQGPVYGALHYDPATNSMVSGENAPPYEAEQLALGAPSHEALWDQYQWAVATRGARQAAGETLRIGSLRPDDPRYLELREKYPMPTNLYRDKPEDWTQQENGRWVNTVTGDWSLTQPEFMGM